MKTITIDYDTYIQELEGAKKKGLAEKYDVLFSDNELMASKLNKIQDLCMISPGTGLYFNDHGDCKAIIDQLVDILNKNRTDSYILNKAFYSFNKGE